MIRKESSADIGYSVIDLGSTRHVYASAVPREGTTLEQQTRDALRTIEAVFQEEGSRESIVQQAVFLKDIDDLQACRRLIRGFYGKHLPATSYVLQPPCSGKRVELEAFGVVGKRGDVEIQRYDERTVTARHDGITWVHIANIVPDTAATGIYDRSLSAFHSMDRQLTSHGLRFDQVVRTWLYLGDIVGSEGATQRYKELNRARTDFYEGIDFAVGHRPKGFQKPFYPASSGIGASGNDVMMSCLAMATDRSDVQLMPLENPQQTAACDYGAEYGQKSPKFARAMALTAGDFAATIISGTASITRSETRHIEDVEAQTQQTLDNIEALISPANFCRHGMRGLGVALRDLALVRVYIKRQEDYAKTRAICAARLGELPVIYTVADVCRPELLVEIEGVALSRRGT